MLEDQGSVGQRVTIDSNGSFGLNHHCAATTTARIDPKSVHYNRFACNLRCERHSGWRRVADTSIYEEFVFRFRRPKVRHSQCPSMSIAHAGKSTDSTTRCPERNFAAKAVKQFL